MNIYLYCVISAIIGYVIGSIPNALIIGEIFYKTDVRNLGSGNLGATNVARTLGPKAALAVLLADFCKSGLTSMILMLLARVIVKDFSNEAIVYCITGVMASIGHCYPCFANFKGGKAVATISGFVLFSNWKIAIIGIVIFLTVVFISKIVSISSMSMCVVCSICSFIPIIGSCYFYEYTLVYSLTICALSALLIIKHIPNIKRLIKGEEKQFHFAKK